MYGIYKDVTVATESDYCEAIEKIKKIMVAIEQLNELEKTSSGGVTNATNRLKEEIVNNISSEFSEDLGIESLSDVIDNTKIIIKKLFAYAMVIYERVSEAIKNIVYSAERLESKAVNVIGRADRMNVKDNKIKPGKKLFQIAWSLNIKSKVPNNIDEIVLEQLDISRKLQATSTSAVANKIESEVFNKDSEQLINKEALLELYKDFSKILEKALNIDNESMLTGSGKLTYSINNLPGNIDVRITIPNSMSTLYSYYIDVDTEPHPVNKSTTNVETLTPKQVIEIGRAVKIFCHEIKSQKQLRSYVESLSRKFNLIIRKNTDGTDLSGLKAVVRLLETPYMKHSRVMMTICSRALTYCEASIDNYEIEKNQE